MPQNPPPAHWYSLQATDEDWSDLENAVSHQCACPVDAQGTCGGHQLLAGTHPSETAEKVHARLLFGRRLVEHLSNEEFAEHRPAVASDGAAVEETQHGNVDE
jgi:hypothetical protein